jgi:hypothetical protein
MYLTQNNYPVVSNGFPTGWVESNQLKFASKKEGCQGIRIKKKEPL